MGVHRIDLAWDVERPALMVAIADMLEEKFDLKNQRVRELEARFDKLERQTMIAQRREALCRMRRKVR